MSSEQYKQTCKLWLLTCVLALVLAWYIINPAPTLVYHHKKQDDPPNPKRREVEAHASGASSYWATTATLGASSAQSLTTNVEEQCDWPEFIELD